MEQFKRIKVVMLPTDNKTKIALCNKSFHFGRAKNSDSEKYDENILYFLEFICSGNFNYYYLYIISDDEIKEVNFYAWYMNIHKNNVFSKGEDIVNIANWKKIIATTDTSLVLNPTHYSDSTKRAFHTIEYLPQPSQQFIEKYIESYNKGEVITDVLVEYENLIEGQCTCICHKPGVTALHFLPCCYPTYKEILKVNPKDNTITIKKLKNSFTREEILSFGLKCGIAGTLSERNNKDFNELYLELINKYL
jgi:hypothetical protein